MVVKIETIEKTKKETTIVIFVPVDLLYSDLPKLIENVKKQLLNDQTTNEY